MYEKYEVSLNLLHKLIVLNTSGQDVSEVFDDLLGYIVCNFEHPGKSGLESDAVEMKKAVAACSMFLASNITGTEVLCELQKLPPTITEMVWPVYVLRLLFRNLNMGSFAQRSSFHKFATLWAPIII